MLSTAMSRTCVIAARVTCPRRSRISTSSPAVPGPVPIARFKVTAGGRTRQYQMRVDEPEPGRVLTESDTSSSLVTTTTVTLHDGASRVTISTSWNSAGGIGGFFERMFAPRAMRAIYTDELERLNAYARAQRPG